MTGPAGRSGWHEPVVGLLRARAGLTFPPGREREVELAVTRGIQRTGARSAKEYAFVLSKSGPEWDDLIDELTVGESYFFREPLQFDFMAREVIPRLSRARSGPLRAWSAGCAEGQEAYSLAILLDRLGLGRRGRIFGTDISCARLDAARLARYRRWSLRGVPQPVTEEFFVARGGRFELVPWIRDRVELRRLNLVEAPAAPRAEGTEDMHLILCRNVLIYLDGETVGRVASRLIGSLAEDGWLFLGASDPPLGEYVACERVPTGAGVAYRRPRRRRRGPPPAATVEPDLALPSPPPPPSPAGALEADPHRPIRATYDGRAYDRVADLSESTIERGADDYGGWVPRVRSLANRGCLEEAERICVTALERHRTDPELVHLHAVLLAAAGRFDESAAAARRALYLDRGLVVAQVALGHALARSGDLEGARRAYRNAQRRLAGMRPDEVVPASDGETALRLRRHVRLQLRLLDEAA